LKRIAERFIWINSSFNRAKRREPHESPDGDHPNAGQLAGDRSQRFDECETAEKQMVPLCVSHVEANQWEPHDETDDEKSPAG
jgi:hypothetical protein